MQNSRFRFLGSTTSPAISKDLGRKIVHLTRHLTELGELSTTQVPPRHSSQRKPKSNCNTKNLHETLSSGSSNSICGQRRIYFLSGVAQMWSFVTGIFASTLLDSLKNRELPLVRRRAHPPLEWCGLLCESTSQSPRCAHMKFCVSNKEGRCHDMARLTVSGHRMSGHCQVRVCLQTQRSAFI